MESLIAQGDLPKARAALLAQVARRPADAGLLEQLARVLARLGELPGAEHYAAKACKAAPTSRTTLLLLLELRAALGLWDQAEPVAQRTIELNHDNPEAWRNWLYLLQSGGAAARAELFARRARERFSADPDFVYKHALALASLGRAAQALRVLDEGCARFPGSPDLLRGRAFMLNALEDVSVAQIRAAHVAMARALETGSISIAGTSRPPATPSGVTRGHEPLRVGLLSADLRRHSVGYFIAPLLREHAHSGLDLRVYSTAAKEDELSHSMIAALGAERWRSLGAGAGPQRIAETITGDGVEVLIDLGGLSAGASLEVLIRRPAPVQATYLGYPNTTGLSCVDYRIVDAITDPPGPAGSDSHCVEELIRLPRCAWCYDAGPAPPVEARAAGAAITFGSFNTLSKLNDFTLRLWAGMLAATPGSRLLIKSHGLDDRPSREDLTSRAKEAGVDPSRLDLLGRIEPREAHLRAYGRVDIALDPFPYHGTTTTCEAALMGVPVITLEGDQHRSRVGVSLLATLGLEDLVARTESEFSAKGAALASDRPRLASLRTTLRGRLLGGPLCDAVAFARAFGDGVRAMVASPLSS